jgi:hypothetical protein
MCRCMDCGRVVEVSGVLGSQVVGGGLCGGIRGL